MSGTQTVVVGCKHPNGLVLNLDQYEVTDTQRQTVRKIAGKTTVTLRGTAHKFGEPNLVASTGGYRLTPIPADFWEAWFERNKDSPLIHDRVILPPPSANGRGNATAQAVEHTEIAGVSPPLNPDGDGRIGGLKTQTPKEIAKD